MSIFTVSYQVPFLRVHIVLWYLHIRIEALAYARRQLKTFTPVNQYCKLHM